MAKTEPFTTRQVAQAIGWEGDLEALDRWRRRDPDELLTTEGAARLLKRSPRTLEKARMTGDGPPFVKLSPRCVRYRRRDLYKHVEERLRASTSDPGSGGS